MGSSGSGRISDYPGSNKTGNGGGNAGSADRCGRAFAVTLEDIEHCDFYKIRGTVPPPGQKLRIALRKRVVAETEDGMSVGNLPTGYNYLGSCLKEGWTYAGTVTASTGTGSVARISADFAPASQP